MEYAAASIPQKKKKHPYSPYHKKYPFTSTGKSVISISTIFFSHQSGIIILWEGGVLVFSGFAHIGRDGNACFLHFRKER
ncbi:MAG: hypothetical protein IPN20_08110 [Haliscomenobacter sp.]|nr:hypothetical protein [Haliscomenobacter sp.]